MPRKYDTAINRIDANSVTNPITGCQVWQGGHSTQGSYPYAMDDNGQVRPVHQIVYEYHHGEIPTGAADGSRRYEVHHLCGNRDCCNVEHLTLLTSRQHAARHTLRSAARRFVTLQTVSRLVSSGISTADIALGMQRGLSTATKLVRASRIYDEQVAA